MLKSLELFGFKTFADRTRFDFDRGITCIVGPNGSGKSNIVDAIKWILGDQSPKSLRGKEMIDVIFNGSASRKPSSFAEATMTLDNSSAWLPIDATEVQIGRRLWRNGDSEYLINGQPARLRDVRNLMLGTGAAHGAYNIIEQGRVDQILQATPQARRTFFEEAAGISRYKARKAEAERKLERVAHNVERLRDIVDEVEGQLTTTRSQAAKAAKFRELSEQVRRLWFGLAADEFRHLQGQLDEAEKTAALARNRIAELSEQQARIEQQQAKLDEELMTLEKSLHSLERQAAGLREEIVTRRSTVRHQTARRCELQNELAQLRKQQRHLLRRSAKARQDAQAVAEQLAQAERDRKKLQVELRKREEDLQETVTQLEQERQRLQAARQKEPELVRVMVEQQKTLERLGEQLEQCQGELASVRHQLDQTDAEVRQLGEQVEAQQRRLAAQQEQTQRTIEQWKVRRDELERALAKLSLSQSRLANLRQQRTAVAARLEVLEDLEKRQEGISLGVRDILDRAAKSNRPPWCHILGSVADLMEVDLEEAPFLEVALGHRAQLLVLDDMTPLLEWLSSNPVTFAGRVGFLAVPDERTEAIEAAVADQSGRLSPLQPRFTRSLHRLPDLSGLEGVIKRADEMVEPTGIGGRLAKFLLADTWIVDTLGTAIELSRGRGRGCRFVTLQGELLEPDGVLYAGMEQPEQSIVPRKTELRRLRRALENLEEELDQEQNRLADIDRSLRQLQEAVQEAERRRDLCTKDEQRERQALEELQQQLASLQSKRQALLDAQDRITERQGQLRTQCQDVENRLKQLQRQRHTLAEEIASSERRLQHLEHRQQALQLAVSDAKLQAAKKDQLVRTLAESWQHYQNECKQWLGESKQVEANWQSCRDRIRHIELEVLNAEAEAAELYWRLDGICEQLRDISARKHSLRAQRNDLNELEIQARRDRRAADQELHEAEIRVRDLRHQLHTTQRRIEEEFQIPFGQVLQSGASAVRDYLQQQHAKENRSENSSNQSQPADIEASRDSLNLGDAATSDSETQQGDGEEGGVGGVDGPAAEPQKSEEPEIRFEDVRPELERRLARLRRKLKALGNVDTESLKKLEELESRYSRLRRQLDDLVEAKTTLQEIIRKINVESRKLFLQSFETIRKHFQELYQKLFAGGDADIILEDPSDALECGIDIVARPPGKESRSISLLSGGEKTLTAIALLLAIFKSRPSPFCVLDEVDAALDEANIDRYAAILKRFKERTQFIIVTHSKRTMVVADRLYGITMEQSGVSKKLSLRFEDIGENGEILQKNSSTQNAQTSPRNNAA